MLPGNDFGTYLTSNPVAQEKPIIFVPDDTAHQSQVSSAQVCPGHVAACDSLS